MENASSIHAEKRKVMDGYRNLLEMDDDLLAENSHDFLLTNLINMNNHALEANVKLNQRFDHVRPIESSTFSPRKSKHGNVAYEDGTIRDVRNLFELIQDNTFDNDDGENLAKQICTRHSMSKIVAAILKIFDEIVGNTDISGSSWETFAKMRAIEDEKHVDENREKIATIDEKIKLIEAKNAKLSTRLTTKIKAISERHGREKADLLDNIVRMSRDKECWEYFAKRCDVWKKVSKSPKSPDKIRAEIGQLRLERENRIHENNNKIDEGNHRKKLRKTSKIDDFSDFVDF